MRTIRTVAGALAVLLAACGSGPSPYEALSGATTTARPGPASADPPASLSGSGTTVAPANVSAGTGGSGAPTGTAAAIGGSGAGSGSGSGSGVPQLIAPAAGAAVPAMLSQGQVGNAAQAVVVTASAPGTPSATLTAYQRSGSTWTATFGPWPARIGARGFAPPGEKREGDERTPSGTFGFDFMFGVDPDPGVKFPYRRVTESIVWVDDPRSPFYNQWVDTASQPVNANVERMYQPQAYRHGVVIAYNTARTPNLGSAIFMHASTGTATAGCVSVPADLLIQLLKWLDPALNPRIVMGVG